MNLSSLLADPKPWLTTAEVAELQGVRAETVARWCKADRIPCRKMGSQYRVPLSFVLEACNIDPALLIKGVAS